MNLETIPKEWDTTGRQSHSTRTMERIPTADEIREILAPWRPLRWRQAALTIWKSRDDEAIWLRTHYAHGDDKFAEWRDIDEDYDPAFDEGSAFWTKLDDPEILDFGESWERVFDVLPELAGPQQGYSRGFGSGYSGDYLPSLRQRLRDAVARAEDKGEEVEHGHAGTGLQVVAVETYLLLADAEAFETRKLRVLFLDSWGNIVRYSRIEPEDIFDLRSRWGAAKYRDGEYWLDKKERGEPGGVLGEKYRASGEIGLAIYGIEGLCK
ncbi:uncharacterized protein GGS22DRAFT_157604 [Annulohypoxylon maeteangense]|uniref:uncharacterized protein n=1 Tax=Annulohypoxylon maeteangense TaxID=1927788 RepID=UPI0020074A76|nr:uncharacterized protein GGS22DRAFT_157604 [Annulohypoxylon maeteangense]KAI0887611.1 hypothetical protein GGS22DRAFT_157604 [Annulohypoxylon maeteangense]